MATTATNRSLIGVRIGNYEIASLLGEGGMGAVYLARHALINRQVAIKVLHPEHTARADAGARWLVEARAAGEIRHDNIVEVLDCGVAELGERGAAHYIVMEHLEGHTLRAEIALGATAPARAIAIAVEVGRALEAAHAKSVVHRDIKPENIFVLDGDALNIKVLDFGIAKIVDGHPFAERITRSGTTLGTPTYMAPEQLDGQGVDGRVDVYALAIVLYEMLAGRVPYGEETTARGVWRRMNEVPILPDEIVDALPAGIDDLLALALDPDPARRPTMVELVRGLVDPIAAQPHDAATRRNGPVRAPAPTKRTTPASAPHRSRRWLAVTTIGAAVAVAVVAYVATRATARTTPLQDLPHIAAVPAPAPGPGPAPAPGPGPAPAPAPGPGPAPAPDTVTIRVTSRPSGADVYVGDEPAPRGTTPAAIVLPRGDRTFSLRIHLDRADLRRSIGALTDGNVDVTLPATTAHHPLTAPATAVAAPDAAAASPRDDHTLPYDDSLLPPERAKK